MMFALVVVGFVGTASAGGGCGGLLTEVLCLETDNCRWGNGSCALFHDGRRLEDAHRPTSWSKVEMACRVPFEAAHEINDQLHGIVDQGIGSSAEAAMEGPVKHLEAKCFNIARENIAAVGIMFKENPGLITQLKDNAKSEAILKAARMLVSITEAKQCLAYLELAKRGNPKALFWAWLNNSGTVGERYEACGDVVNSVNDLLSKDQIPGARVEADGERIIVEDFPLGDRIKAAENQAGLGSLLNKAVAVGSSGALAATGSLLAGICKTWQHMQG